MEPVIARVAARSSLCLSSMSRHEICSSHATHVRVPDMTPGTRNSIQSSCPTPRRRVENLSHGGPTRPRSRHWRGGHSACSPTPMATPGPCSNSRRQGHTTHRRPDSSQRRIDSEPWGGVRLDDRLAAFAGAAVKGCRYRCPTHPQGEATTDPDAGDESDPITGVFAPSPCTCGRSRAP